MTPQPELPNSGSSASRPLPVPKKTYFPHRNSAVARTAAPSVPTSAPPLRLVATSTEGLHSPEPLTHAVMLVPDEVPVPEVLAVGDDPTNEGCDEPVLESSDSAPLGKAMGKGLAWSLLNNAIARMGNFLAGIVVVRILSPHDYGTYAVGMVVLNVLLSMNELGVSVAVIQRKGSVERIAPTVMSLAIASSATLAILGFLAAPLVAGALHSPEATGLIRLLVFGVLLDGLGSVPNALITRAFAQRKRLRIDLTAFLCGTPVTIGLALSGAGAWSLGWGAIVANAVTAGLAFAWAPARYRPGWDPAAAREVLRFGLPLAGASLLLLVMLNVDYVVVGHTLGTEQLGFYLLAFNLASWPITVITTAIRRVSLAAFARMHEAGEGSRGFERTVTVILALTLPVCTLLGSFAPQVIEILYGARWGAAAAPLRFVAVLSAGRIAVELTYDYLAATGRTRSSMWLHAVWLAALAPALTLGARWHGIAGVGEAHAVVVGAVLLPTLGVLLHRAGVSVFRTVRGLGLVLAGCVEIMGIAFLVTPHVRQPVVSLALGATISVIVYAAFVSPLRHTAKALWRTR